MSERDPGISRDDEFALIQLRKVVAPKVSKALAKV